MGISQFDYERMAARVEAANARADGKPIDDSVPREDKLRRDVLDECQRRGWIVLAGNPARRTGRTIGEFDLTVLADAGRVFHVELKSKSGKLRPEQAALHAWAKKLGHSPAVVRSMAEFVALVDAS